MEQLNHKEVEELAYRLWQERGSPIGSPDQDWFRAEAELGLRDWADRLDGFAFAMEPTEQ
jgi:hypothetical protein